LDRPVDVRVLSCEPDEAASLEHLSAQSATGAVQCIITGGWLDICCRLDVVRLRTRFFRLVSNTARMGIRQVIIAPICVCTPVPLVALLHVPPMQQSQQQQK
jgi:hypothetical protein